MSSKDSVSQIIKASVTVVTLIALTGGFRIIKAALDHMSRLASGTLDTIGPAQLTNGLITLHIIDKILGTRSQGPLDSLRVHFILDFAPCFTQKFCPIYIYTNGSGSD